MQDRDRRLSEVYKTKFGRWLIHSGPGFAAGRFRFASGNDIVQMSKDHESQPVASSKYAIVHRCTFLLRAKQVNCYIKQYLNRSAVDVLKHLFRPSRAKRAFTAGLMLTENGFLTPAPLALGQYRQLGICTKNFLITAEVADAIPMHKCLRTTPDKESLLADFGQTVGKMHAAGIFHGDLRMGNVLAKKDGANWRFWFLDNERTKKFTKLPDALRIKNLVQINMFRDKITQADRETFFEAYLTQNPDQAGRKNALAQSVLTKTNKRLENKG